MLQTLFPIFGAWDLQNFRAPPPPIYKLWDSENFRDLIYIWAVELEQILSFPQYRPWPAI